MRPESIFIVITVLGAVVAALSHGLQLFDRLHRWRASKRATSTNIFPVEESARKSSALVFAVAALVVLSAGGIALLLRERPVAGPGASAGMLVPPKGPSVAVLPFKFLGDSAEGRVIAEGLTHNVTTALSTVSGLFVVAQHSMTTYREQDPELSRVGREQGVRNILSGAVQRSNDKLRITANLNEASTGQEIWSDRFDRRTEDLFDMEDDIALSVATALQIRLTDGEQARFRRKGTRNFESWRLATLAFEAFERYDPASNAEARRLSEEATRLDPGYPWAWTTLASARLIAARFGYAEDPLVMLEQAKLAAQHAIELDPLLAAPYSTMSVYHLMHREFDLAEDMGRRAIALEPSSAEIHALLAQTLFFRGRWKDAISQSREAVRLSPIHPSWYLIWQAWGNVYLGDVVAGLAAARRMLEIAESPLQRAVAFDSIAFALVESGDVARAQEAATAARNAVPSHDLAFHRRSMHFEDPANFERFATAMKQAGLPD